MTADGQGCCSGDGVVIKAASGNGSCRKDDVAQKIADGGGSWTNVVPNVSWHPAELFSVTGDASTSFWNHKNHEEYEVFNQWFSQTFNNFLAAATNPGSK